jgi:membrane protein YdbS with pleckstrin-like domain
MQFKCPHCGAVLSAPPEAVGCMITCQDCGGNLQIPTPVAAVANPAIPPSRVSTSDNETRASGVEINVWTGTPSQWVGFGAYFWCLLLAIVFAVAAVLLHRYFWFGLLLPLFIAFGKFLRIKATRYELTSQRLKIITGIVDRKEVEIELFRLRDLSLEQGFLQRIANVGTVVALSSDKDAPAIHLQWVNNPDAVKDKLRTFIMEARRTTGTRDIDLTDTGR